MTWTKLGDEFLPTASDLSDAAFRTHVEALIWSSWRLLDLNVPKRDVRRFASTEDYTDAIHELVAAGWWEDRQDHWHIGLRFPDWQLERAEVESRRAKWAEDKRRQRAHQRGDHSSCSPRYCKAMSKVDSKVESSVASGVGVGVGTGELRRALRTDSGDRCVAEGCELASRHSLQTCWDHAALEQGLAS